MPLLVFIGLVVAFGYFYPRAANVAAWIITLVFIVPFFSLAFGTVSWSVGILTNSIPFGLESWKTCMLFLGCPAGILLGISILKE